MGRESASGRGIKRPRLLAVEDEPVAEEDTTQNDSVDSLGEFDDLSLPIF